VSTDIVLRTGAELSVDDEFARIYPALAPDPAMIELLAESLGEDDLGVNDLPRIRVPAAGGTQWAITQDGEEAHVKELRGVLVHHKPQRVFWIDSEPSGKSPDCASRDGKRPDAEGLYGQRGARAAENPTALCANCPMSQPGSDPNPKNKGTACKEQKLLFVVMRDKMFPAVVVVPPSSLREIKQFMIGLVTDRKPWWTVEISLTLEKATNSAGVEFARIKAKPIGALGESEALAVRDYGEYMKGMVSAAAPGPIIETPTMDDGGGLRVPDGEPAPA
jgi:hypothetical protein